MIVPDFARGIALLGIALANASVMWFAPYDFGPAFFYGGTDGGALDNLTILITSITAHVRGLPMFSTLLGFGVGLITLSLWRRGFPVGSARRTIVRRYGFLAIFGLIHALFIFPGDILFYYGISAMLLATMIAMKDKTIMIIAWVLLALNVVGGISSALLLLTLDEYSINEAAATMVTTIRSSSVGGFLWDNIGHFFIGLLNFPVYICGYLPLMLIGFMWARNGVLAQVDQNKKTLTSWCAAAAVIALATGGFMAASALGDDSTRMSLVAIMLNSALGVFTGPGILAGIALALNSAQKKVNAGSAPALWIAVPAALGKRSMSGYLMQSLLFAIISFNFFLGLGHYTGAFTVACLATGVWLVTLGLAWILEKKNIQGPCEFVHRRLAYGPTMRPELPSSNAPAVIHTLPKQPHDAQGTPNPPNLSGW
jgi:uncharacterized membrane protein YeiB